MDKDLERRLEEFRKAASAVADDVIFKIFPMKILELQELIDSTKSPSSPFHESHGVMSTDATVYPPPDPRSSEGPETKKRKLEADDFENVSSTSALTHPNDVYFARYPNLILANQHLVKVYDRLKKECEQLADLCDKVKLWVNLSMPKIEDGDNFGVQIQEEVLTEIHRSQESAYNLRDASRQAHLNRAKICSKVIKYPHVEDYTLAMKELDEKLLYVARQNLYDIRNIYAILMDILHKNIAKIRSPKGNNQSGLY
ncbi:proteasome activator pa28, REG alpha/beta subunit [Laetiporus sulphureus 93-53]|uniref:Proteasome activator pa28, REG alpha/beta subunit n=1 Tax=Laetiporus sulphureus 93-53 TaxID=1314785 RepID=A0A165F7M2_9APHY|nr:proteasome activator pa28, REG alpha/beta subunit [Laetiporus sulphureus 93-53]KZT08546.1 proteasome activator pa28, REG alpha/beta subunit [Laetiporus sulphureus 93-53]